MRDAGDVVIIGGGLAGLSAAYRLATVSPSRRVRVYEQREVLGGKARSFASDGTEAHEPFNPYRSDVDLSWLTPTADKGYHIFPSWYWELWDLVDTIGFGDHFFDRKKRRGVPNPRARSYALFMPPLEDLSFHGSMGTGGERRSRAANKQTFLPNRWWHVWEFGPPLSMALTGLGLAASSGRTVEHMTVPDFISTRWYNGSERASVLQDMIVKALANPSKHTSAYTMRQMFRRWIPTVLSGNSWTPANGPLQQCLIDPIVSACRTQEVEFIHATVTDITESGSRITEVEISTEEGPTTIDVSDAQVIVALPPDVLLDIIRREPQLLSIRSLAQLTHLRTAPMGAIDLYFIEPDADYPPHLRAENFTQEHFTLIESEFGLTGFQISGIEGWEPHLGGAPGLVLQFVVGNAVDIHELPVEMFARLLIDEVAEYLDFDPHQHLLGCVAIPSTDEQLTMNDAGTWDKRPPANIREIDNLFLAGDYVKLSVDVAGMEAAVESGVNAARAILLAEELDGHDPDDDRRWIAANEVVFEKLPPADNLPPWHHKAVVWPTLRLVFGTTNHVIGWLVMFAKWPLIVGHDFVGSLHDRYEDHVSSHQRKKGFGIPVGGRDRFVIGAGLAALLFGFLAAWLLPARLDGYDHLTDSISVLGRESPTRFAYVVASVFGWIGLQLFGAAVRKFVPGSQVLTWMFGWFGWLWFMAALFPICPEDATGSGRTCATTAGTVAQIVHYASATGLVVLFILMPAFTWRYVLRNLPRGYEVNWSLFRRISGVFAVATLASGAYFALSLVPSVGLSAGFGQRLHWTVGNVWIVLLVLWLWFRRHRDITGQITDPPTPVRAVDQRSLWA